MTLTEALFKLHAAGRIAAPWLRGMRVLWPIGNGVPNRAGRIVAANRHGIQLLEWEAVTDRRTWGMADIPRHWRPDIGDAATRGVLLALFREAASDPEAYVEHSWQWRMVANCEGWPWAPTDGEALAAALVQLAESTEPPTPLEAP